MNLDKLSQNKRPLYGQTEVEIEYDHSHEFSHVVVDIQFDDEKIIERIDGLQCWLDEVPVPIQEISVFDLRELTIWLIDYDFSGKIAEYLAGMMEHNAELNQY